jgi:hypothetical protein
MTPEAFLDQLHQVRRAIQERMQSIQRGEPSGWKIESWRVPGYNTPSATMQKFLDELDEVEKEVASGSFKSSSKERRALGAARVVVDCWSFEDPLGGAICELSTAYGQL